MNMNGFQRHDDSPYSRNGTRYAKKSLPSRRAFVVGGAVVAGVAALGCTGTAYSASVIDNVKDEASNLSAVVHELVDSLKTMDFARAYELSMNLEDALRGLRSRFDGPLWGLAEALPVYGGDVKAAKGLLPIAEKLTTEVLQPLTELLATKDLKTIVSAGDGSFWVDVAFVQQVSDIVTGAVPTIHEAVSYIDSIGELHVEKLSNMVQELKDGILPFADQLDEYADMLALAPQLLGADGQSRTYLVVAQNNVEIRPLGGFAGAWCPVYVNGGTVTLGEVSNVSLMPANPDIRIDMSDEELLMFGEAATYTPSSAAFNPDFPRVCDWWQQYWWANFGEQLYGVIAADPMFFQGIASLTSGVMMSDGNVLDGTNAARVLMHDVYWNNMGDNDSMDAYFAEAVSAMMDSLSADIATLDFKRLVEVIKAGRDNYNLLLWLSDETGEKLLDKFGFSGRVGTDSNTPQLGVYFSNESWSKIEWWLDADLQLSDPWEGADQRMCYRATLQLANVLTWDEVEAADSYILGVSRDVKYSQDDIVDTVFLYAPAGGYIDELETSGEVALGDGSYNGLQVVFGTAHVMIDAPVTISFTVVTAPNVAEPLSVRMTPTVTGIR